MTGMLFLIILGIFSAIGLAYLIDLWWQKHFHKSL